MATTKAASEKKTCAKKACAPKTEAKTEVKAEAVAAAKTETKVEAPKAEAKKTEAKKTCAKKACATKTAAKKAPAKKAPAKKAAKTTKVEATQESICNAIAAKAKKAKFSADFVATQITLKGALECAPLYVKVEEKKAEVAPYEYNDACFYIDADAETMANILNGKKTIYAAIEDGSVVINGDANKAVLFVSKMF